MRAFFVLIPFRSGHQSGRGRCSNNDLATSLNPFQIRASVRTPGRRLVAQLLPVLIPFRSGHQSGRTRRSHRRRRHVLIPFRSGHQSGQVEANVPSIVSRLNPFQIRASVRTETLAEIHEMYVLIPFRSGHQSGRRQPLQLPFNNQVLIPFRSGHQSGRPLRQLPRWKPRLNPFQIRASVRTAISNNVNEFRLLKSGAPHFSVVCRVDCCGRYLPCCMAGSYHLAVACRSFCR